jgi:hypothetical protein
MLFGETVAVYCENHTEHTDTVRTSQESHYISATNRNRLMLFGETVAVYCENHMEHADTLCGQNVLKPVVHILTTLKINSRSRSNFIARSEVLMLFFHAFCSCASTWICPSLYTAYILIVLLDKSTGKLTLYVYVRWGRVIYLKLQINEVQWFDISTDIQFQADPCQYTATVACVRKRRQKGNPAPGGITEPLCSCGVFIQEPGPPGWRVSYETVKYDHEFCGTRTEEWEYE